MLAFHQRFCIHMSFIHVYSYQWLCQGTCKDRRAWNSWQAKCCGRARLTSAERLIVIRVRHATQKDYEDCASSYRSHKRFENNECHFWDLKLLMRKSDSTRDTSAEIRLNSTSVMIRYWPFSSILWNSGNVPGTVSIEPNKRLTFLHTKLWFVQKSLNYCNLRLLGFPNPG